MTKDTDFQRERLGAIEAAVAAYRRVLDADQPTNMNPGDPRLKVCADAGEILADRIEQVLRSSV